MQVYKITYPNGKIYVGSDVTGTLTYFGSPSAAAKMHIARDHENQRHDFSVRKQICGSPKMPPRRRFVRSRSKRSANSARTTERLVTTSHPYPAGQARLSPSPTTWRRNRQMAQSFASRWPTTTTMWAYDKVISGKPLRVATGAMMRSGLRARVPGGLPHEQAGSTSKGNGSQPHSRSQRPGVRSSTLTCACASLAKLSVSR